MDVNTGRSSGGMRTPDQITHKGVKLSAALEAHERFLLSLPDGERLVWDGASLEGASLEGALLEGASLEGASLEGASLEGASLEGASLEGALLWGCVGNMKEVRSMQIGTYAIAYTAQRIQIGCKNFAIDEWRAFDDETISEMDKGACALDWWRVAKPILFAAVDAFPATPTGHEVAA